ncbi:MAG: Hpt domain-containing protein [Pseudomonadota bacterium]
MSGDPIDWARVAELLEDIGEEDFAEVAGLFLEEIAETAEPLDPAASDLSAQLHGLKGSALNLGFATLAGLAAQGEAAPDTADIPAIRAACADATAALRACHPDIA